MVTFANKMPGFTSGVGIRFRKIRDSWTETTITNPLLGVANDLWFWGTTMLFPLKNQWILVENRLQKPGIKVDHDRSVASGELPLVNLDLLGHHAWEKIPNIFSQIGGEKWWFTIGRIRKKTNLNKKRSGLRFKPQNSTRKFPGEVLCVFPLQRFPRTWLIDIFSVKKTFQPEKPQRNANNSPRFPRCVALSWRLCPTLFAPKKSLGRYHLPVAVAKLCQSQEWL